MIMSICCSRKITDITPEENYFLVVVHAFTKIVYPVIKHQLSKHCPADDFDKIRTNIYGEQTAPFKRDSLKRLRRSSKKRIYLTQNKKEQLFSNNSEFIFLTNNADCKIVNKST